jgi:hypothetical protein
MNSFVTIILLNWNSENDTLECLQSVFNQKYKKIRIVLLDNASNPESVQKIYDFLLSNSESEEEINPTMEEYQKYIQRISKFHVRGIEIYFIQNRENLGFARANNIGIVFNNKHLKSEYILLLNNDTVVDENFLIELIKPFTRSQTHLVATPVIYYYDDPKKIHNAGGRLVFPARRRYFTQLPKKQTKEITFITGCALFTRAKLFDDFGLLSEKFFFGEEDFEFSYRLKLNKIKMIVVRDSRVYHKVSISSDKFFDNAYRKSIIYALNRLVDLKDYYPKWYWHIWKFIVLGYFFILFHLKYHLSVRKSIRILKAILHMSSKLNEVSRKTVDDINSGVYDMAV